MTALLRLVAADGQALDQLGPEPAPQQEEPMGEFARAEDLERLEADLDRLARIVARHAVLMAHLAGVPSEPEPQPVPPGPPFRVLQGGAS